MDTLGQFNANVNITRIWHNWFFIFARLKNPQYKTVYNSVSLGLFGEFAHCFHAAGTILIRMNEAMKKRSDFNKSKDTKARQISELNNVKGHHPTKFQVFLLLFMSHHKTVGIFPQPNRTWTGFCLVYVFIYSLEFNLYLECSMYMVDASELYCWRKNDEKFNDFQRKRLFLLKKFNFMPFKRHYYILSAFFLVERCFFSTTLG